MDTSTIHTNVPLLLDLKYDGKHSQPLTLSHRTQDVVMHYDHNSQTLYIPRPVSLLSACRKTRDESRDKASWYNTVSSRCKKQSTWYHSYLRLFKKGRRIHQCLGGKGTLINISLTGWFSSTTCISIYQSLSKKGRPIQCLGGKGGHITDGMFLMHNTISIYLIESIREGKITRKMQTVWKLSVWVMIFIHA